MPPRRWEPSREGRGYRLSRETDSRLVARIASLARIRLVVLPPGTEFLARATRRAIPEEKVMASTWSPDSWRGFPILQVPDYPDPERLAAVEVALILVEL